MAATVLSAGDFAIIGYNGGSSDSTGRPATTDKIHFVLLNAIGSGTTIYLTDRTWNGTSFSNTGTDGTYTYTTNVDVAAGTVVTITAAQLIAAGVDFEHIAGEAIYAYQGTNANTPTNFLFALEGGDGNTTFNASLANTGLVAGTTAISVPYDSGAYSGPTTHAGAFLFNGTSLIASIADSTNWSGADSTAHTGGQNALEAQVQTGPWLVAPSIDLWGAAAGGGGAIIRTSADQTISGGSFNYNHAELYNGALSGGVSVFYNPRDITFDTVEGKFFLVDSDINGHNRILQGNIADLQGNPGNLPTLTVLYSDAGTTTAARLDNLEVDTVNNLIYFTHGNELLKIGFNAANQTPTLLFRANVSAVTSPSGTANPAGSTNNFFNDMAINFTTGSIYLSSTRVGASAGGDVVSKNFIYELTGLTTGSGTDAFQFNASNTGTARLLPFAQNDDAYNPNPGTTPDQVSTTADPYFLAKEFGTLDGLAIDPTTNTLYFSTGAILFDHNSDGASPIYTPGIIGRYALGANAANGQGAISVLHTQPGGQGTGLYGDLEIDVATGKWYVTDYNGTGANNEDSHLYAGSLSVTGGARTQFSGDIGNIEGLSTVGFTINHAPTLSGTAVGGTSTETTQPNSGTSSTVGLFAGTTLDDIDTGPGNELSGAVVRIASNFQTGATHQDLLLINGTTSGNVAGTSINYTYNIATGAMVLTGQGTVAQYKAAIELVTFATSGDNPTNYGTVGTRTIAAAISDGLSVSDEITASVTVVGINDAPVNTVGGTTAATEEVSIAVTGISVFDADANPASQNITVTLAVSNGALTIATNVAGGIVAGNITGGANGSATLTLTGTQNQINATLAAANALTYAPNANFNGADALVVTTNDNGFNGVDPSLTGTPTSEQDQDSKTITIANVNDAPTVTDTSAVNAASIAEDQPSATGETVASLFGSRFADTLDQQQTGGNPTGSVANTLAGIAITANGSGANGSWQYYNGSSWTPIGSGAVASARLIAADTAIRFVPAADYNGPAGTLTVVLIDSSFGTVINNATVNVTTRGGTTAFSTATLVLNETVTAVNDAPVFAGSSTASATEQTTAAVLTGVTVSDVELSARNSANGNFAGAVLSVNRNSGSNADDVFSIVNGSNFTVSGANLQSGGQTFATYSVSASGFIAITFTSSGTIATSALVNDVISAIRYTNSSDVPPASVQLAVGLTDGGADNTQGSGGTQVGVRLVTVNITAVNDAPVVTPPTSANLTPAPNGGATALFAGVTLSDVDYTGYPVGGQLVLSSNVAGDALALMSGSGFTVAGGTISHAPEGAIGTISGLGTATVTVNFSGAASVALAGQLARAFELTVGNTASSQPHTVTLTFTDNGTAALSAGTTQTVTLDYLYQQQPIGAGGATGTAFPDFIDGRPTNDTLDGQGGDDRLYGRDGDDVLIGGTGADILYGGNGTDIASYAGNSGAVLIDLTAHTVAETALTSGTVTLATAVVSTDRVFEIEGAIGSAYGDRFYGTTGNDSFAPGAGADVAYGQGGIDTIDYATGTGAVYIDLTRAMVQETALTSGTVTAATATVTTDLVFGFSNAVGTAFGDRFYGTAGNNVFTPGAGNDIAYGNGGTDTIDYSNGAGAVFVDLNASIVYETARTTGTVGSDAAVSTDYVFGFVNANGSAFGDRLIGTSAANQLAGGAGDDVLYGGDGNDVILGGDGDDKLIGENGADTLTGGNGADQFFFIGGETGGADTITDFTVGIDKLMFAAANFGGSVGGTATLVTGTNPQAVAPNSFLYDSSTGTLSFDADGAGGNAPIVIANIGAGLGITTSDLVFF